MAAPAMAGAGAAPDGVSTMRVLFDWQAFSLQPHGGISRYVRELASQLARRDDVTVQVFGGWHRNEALRGAAPPWLQGRYVPHWPKTSPLRRAINAFLMRRAVRHWQPDLIHETYFRMGRKIRSRLPVVLTVYDLIYFVLPDTDADAARVRRAQHSALERADRVVCISESTRRDLLRFVPLDAAKVSVTPLGPPPLPNIDGGAPPDTGGPYVLHVGERQNYKNFDLLLQAWARSEELRAKMRVVAFSNRPFTAAERNRQRALGLDEKLVLHRGGDDATLARYYTSATALVCPSRYEGFGLPVLEAMARGCPVVCSNTGALPETAGNAALLFDPTSASELVRALESLVRAPAMTEDLRARGLRRVAQFSWDRCADETLAVYRSLLREPAR